MVWAVVYRWVMVGIRSILKGVWRSSGRIGFEVGVESGREWEGWGA